MLTALVEVAALTVAFALGVMLSSTVKKALGITEEDMRVELGLLRADISKIVHDMEERLHHLENKQSS